MSVFYTFKDHTFNSLDHIAMEICSIHPDLRWRERNSSYMGWYNPIWSTVNKEDILCIQLNNGADDNSLVWHLVPASAAIIEFEGTDSSLSKVIYNYLASNPNTYKLLSQDSDSGSGSGSV